MKYVKKVRKECYRRIKKLIESKLYGGNIVKAMNPRAVAAVGTQQEQLTGLFMS